MQKLWALYGLKNIKLIKLDRIAGRADSMNLKIPLILSNN